MTASDDPLPELAALEQALEALHGSLRGSEARPGAVLALVTAVSRATRRLRRPGLSEGDADALRARLEEAAAVMVGASRGDA